MLRQKLRTQRHASTTGAAPRNYVNHPLAGGLLIALVWLSGAATAESLITRSDADLDGNFTTEVTAVTRTGNNINLGQTVILNASLPANATVWGAQAIAGGAQLVYGAFETGNTAFDDLFLVNLATPGVAQRLNLARTPGVDSPFIFSASPSTPDVFYSLRDLSTSTDRLFVSSAATPGIGRSINGTLPAGSSIEILQVSPDGRTMGYRVDLANGSRQIWISFAAGTANGVRVDTGAPTVDYSPNELQFSPDSRKFLWRGNRDVAATPEPLNMVNIDPGLATVSAAVQLNLGSLVNERVFEFEVNETSSQVIYRAGAEADSGPSDSFITNLAAPGTATRLSPPEVSGAGFTSFEDIEFVGDEVIFNSAQDSPSLVELFLTPADGSQVTTKLSNAAALDPSSNSSSQPGVSHMITNRDDSLIAFVDGDPGVGLFVVDPAAPSTAFAPFSLATDQSIALTATPVADGDNPVQFNFAGDLVAMNIDRLANDSVVSRELHIAIPNLSGSQRPLFNDTFIEVSKFVWLPNSTSLAAAILPASRSGQVGTTLTAFATIVNASSEAGLDCAIAVDAIAGDLPIALSYQRTNPTTNEPIGSANTPSDIAGGAAQSYVISAQLLGAFAPADVAFRFACSNATKVGTLAGINTLLLSAATQPVPDVVALAATVNGNGIVDLPSNLGSSAFSVATVNVGAAANISVTADTGSQTLPLVVSLCQSNAITGVCENPTSPTTGAVQSSVSEDATQTYSVFVAGTGNIPDDPATNRIRVVIRDATDTVRGQTSVAIRTN